MKISPHLPGEPSWVKGIKEDVNIAELLELWREGVMIAPQAKETTGKKKPPLESADMVFVAVNLARLPLPHLLAHPFSKQHLTVVGYQGDGKSGTAILGFKLENTVSDGRHVSAVMKGLETLYAGARSHLEVLQGFGAPGLDKFVVPGGALSVKAEKMLANLGRESRSFNAKHYKGNYPSSQHRIGQMTVVRLANGEEVLLEMVPAGTDIYCPVHIDKAAKATVMRSEKGMPVVSCSCCQRTYGVSSDRRYDFGAADRVFARLAAQEKAAKKGSDEPRQFSITRTPFLSPLPLLPGITLVQSGKGTGKTTQLIKLVEECKKKNLRVLLVGHRRTLLLSLASKIGLTNYFELSEEVYEVNQAASDVEVLTDLKYELAGIEPPLREGGAGKETMILSSEIVRNDPSDYYAISLDSLWNLKPQNDQYDVIIIDESEQVCAHLIGKTLGEKRRAVYLRLRHYLRAAQSVYVLDADLNMVTMETLFQAGFDDETPYRVLINHPVERSEVTYLYGNDKHLAECLKKSVAAGEKCFVATNSIEEAKRLAEVVAKQKDGLRVVCIHSENSQTAPMQKVIGNIAAEFEHKIDVLIASPALGTGIDISYRDDEGNPRSVVQKVFGFFKGNITTHFDIDQAVMRVREPGEVHIWVEGRQQFYECDPAVLQDILNDMVKDSYQVLDYNRDGSEQLAPDIGLIEVWARISAAARGSKNMLAELYTELRRRNGYQIVKIEVDEAAKEAGKGSLAVAREVLRVKREEALLAAEELMYSDVQILAERERHGVMITPEQYLQLERYWIEHFYQEEISAELIQFDQGGAVREKIRNFECLAEPVERLMKRDEEELRWSEPFDRRMRVLRRKLLAALLGAAGVYDTANGSFLPSVKVEMRTLGKFVALVQAYRKRVELLFGVVVRRDVRSKPVLQLREILGQVGLVLVEAEVTEAGGPKIRRYRLDEARLQEIMAVVERREEDRLKWEESRADNSTDYQVTNNGRDSAGVVGGKLKQVAASGFAAELIDSLAVEKEQLRGSAAVLKWLADRKQKAEGSFLV